ncbi:hypothetical protein CI102_12837, partial [Trichoderma harzianum]
MPIIQEPQPSSNGKAASKIFLCMFVRAVIHTSPAFAYFPPRSSRTGIIPFVLRFSGRCQNIPLKLCEPHHTSLGFHKLEFVAMLSKSLLALATLLVSGVSADPRDLGTVLAGNKDLSTFYSLIQKYPDVLLQLPSYAGVT